jgi:hypothetical protein
MTAPSKASLRAELEAALATYRGPVKQCPAAPPEEELLEALEVRTRLTRRSFKKGFEQALDEAGVLRGSDGKKISESVRAKGALALQCLDPVRH